MDKQREDDGIWMFPEPLQNDIESGIDQAIGEVGGVKGFYANKVNQNFDMIEPYLQPGFKTPSGRQLTSSDRRRLIKAFCLDDMETFKLLTD